MNRVSAEQHAPVGSQATEPRTDAENNDLEKEYQEETPSDVGSLATSTQNTAQGGAEPVVVGSMATARIKKCKICSFKEVMGGVTGKIRHIHLSSRQRAITATDNNIVKMSCPTCKKEHSSSTNYSDSERLKICVTSSTLAEYWQPRDPSVEFNGDELHIDWLCIPGASVNALSTAWEIEYLKEKKPMDVMLIAGLNDVLKGKSGPAIVASFKHFADLVIWQGEQHHPEQPNTCAIGTLIYPPQICWLEDDGPAPTSFDNQLRNLRWLNHQIEIMNAEAQIRTPSFHTLGLRKVTRNGKGQTKHRLEHWRESERSHKLHLRDDQRIKMAKQVARYFKHET